MKKLFLICISVLFTFTLFAEKPIVKDIQAIAGNSSKINVIWTIPENPDQEITQFLIYRDTKPITDAKTLNKLIPLSELPPNATSFTDDVNDYKDYFYAVIAVTDKPYDIILPTINTLSTGVHLTYKKSRTIVDNKEKTKTYEEGTLREKPLPFIDYIDGLDGKEFLSTSAIEESKKLSSKNIQKVTVLDPYYFEEDLISPDGGDDYLLFDILKNYFVQRDYKSSILYLDRLVGTNISQSTRNRAYFYMGEAYYLLGNYSEAVKIFVRIEKNYPILTKKWIDSSLDNMIN